MTQANILFLMTDEQRFDTFGFNNDKIITPNLDRLIEDSVYFENAYCSNPSCIPSRAAIMTGKFPTACECPTYISQLPATEETYMSKLQKAGYYTAVIGKQHFAGSTINKGHDYEFIVDGHSPNGTKSEIKLYTEYLTKHNLTPKDLYKGGLIVGGYWLGDTKHHIDSFIGDEGYRWLSEHIEKDNKQPWYLTLSFPGPHQPYDLEGTKYSELYDLDNLGESVSKYEDLETKPPHYYKLNPKAYTHKYEDDIFKKTKRAYYANMTLIDEKIGEIIQLLKQTGQYDNTLIIYSTDHGDFMGDFGLVTKAQYLSEALMRVPLFVKPPIAGYQGHVVTDYVTNINIASTVLTVAGGEISADMENQPYSNYWTQNNDEALPYVYMEAHNIKGVIEDGIKVLYYVERNYGELYDLNTDPNERYNLWDDENYAQQKIKGLGRIIDKMFRMSKHHDTKWNTNAPTI